MSDPILSPYQIGIVHGLILASIFVGFYLFGRCIK